MLNLMTVTSRVSEESLVLDGQSRTHPLTHGLVYVDVFKVLRYLKTKMSLSLVNESHK